MASTSKGSKTTWRRPTRRQCPERARGLCRHYHGMLFPQKPSFTWGVSEVCVCVLQGLAEKEMWKYGREVENKIALGCRDRNDICFPWLWQGGLLSSQLLSFRAHACFNACRLTMHCYCTVFMFTSSVIWPKESLQSERLMQNLCLYGCFSQWKNQYCRLDALKWLRTLWLTLKAPGDGELAFAVQGIECIRALVIVCSPYISLSLGLFFDNNYDCGV